MSTSVSRSGSASAIAGAMAICCCDAASGAAMGALRRALLSECCRRQVFLLPQQCTRASNESTEIVPNIKLQNWKCTCS